MLDILIRNAQIVDGTNVPAYMGDIAIEGDHIVAIGALAEASADREIDATGHVVAPGFIDMHSHADLSLLVEPDAQSLVRQGITTVVTGQCGMSPAPLTQEYRAETLQTLSILIPPEASMPWDRMSTFGSFLDVLETVRPAVNVVPLVGQGMIRAAVIGYRADRPTADEIRQMQQLVREAMDQGAFGISTGLIYAPGSFSETDELVDMARSAGECNGIYFSHIRGEAETLIEAVSEAIEIGRRAGAPVQICHLKAAGSENWDKAATALEQVDRARADGLDISADMYPYTGGATYLAALLPKWALEGGIPGLLKRLDVPSERTAIARAMEAGEGGIVGNIEWDRVMISGSARREHVGYHVSELAAREGCDPAIWMLDALRSTQGNMAMVVFLMAEENIRMQLQYPAMMLCTDGLGVSEDGPMARGLMHPRFCGTYPRIFGRYVREEGILSLEEASWKASGFPARKLGLDDRGVIKQGNKADLVILDPATISDRATYAEPLRDSVGIEAVLVNGELVLESGKQTPARPGKVVRRLS